MAPWDNTGGPIQGVSMDIYLSSPSEKALDLVQERCPEMKIDLLLTSARMPSDIDAYMERHKNILRKKALDSVAFSDNNSNLNISTRNLFHRHINHAKVHKCDFDIVFNFDIDFTPDGFYTNQAYLHEMENYGVHPVPVIHNMKSHEIDTFIHEGYDYVAIGKQQNKTKPEVLFPAVFKLHSHGVRTHLFGITEFDLIAGCPATSCDSKSWLDDARTGVVRFWNPAKPGINKTDVIYFPEKLGRTKSGTHLYTRYEHLDEFERFIGNYGLTKDDLRGLKETLNREFLGILYYSQLADVVTKLHAANPLFF